MYTPLTHMQVFGDDGGYLKNNAATWLLYTKQVDIIIEHSDVDQVGSIESRWSTIGYYLFLGGNLVL